MTARTGEVVRLWLTNTANTRVFNVRLPGARMKLVGGDSGRVEHEEFVSEVLLAPSERAVVDVLLDRPGQLTLEHRTPNRIYPLASIAVIEERAEPALTDQFLELRTAPELVAERQHLEPAGRAAGQDPRPGRRDGRPRTPGQRGRRSTPAPCTRKSPATNRAAAPSAG